MGSKLSIPVFDHLDKLTDDELNHYISVWIEECTKAQKQSDMADEKYNALVREYFNRKQYTKIGGDK